MELGAWTPSYLKFGVHLGQDWLEAKPPSMLTASAARLEGSGRSPFSESAIFEADYPQKRPAMLSWYAGSPCGLELKPKSTEEVPSLGAATQTI